MVALFLKARGCPFVQCVFEVDETEAHTSFDRAQGYVISLGNFRMSPTLKIGKLNHLPLFWRKFQKRGTYLRTLYRPPEKHLVADLRPSAYGGEKTFPSICSKAKRSEGGTG